MSTSAISGGAATPPTAVPCVDDAHRRGALADREPLGDRPGRGWKTAPLAHAEQQPADGQHAHARREPVARARQRPEQHDREEAGAGADDVHELAAAGVHHRVRDQERRLQERELRVADGDVPLDRLDRDGQRLAIEIADRNRRADQHRDAPAHRHHSTTIRETAWRGSATCSEARPSTTSTLAGRAVERRQLARRLELLVLRRAGRRR